MRRSKLNLETIYKITRAAIKEKPFITRGRPRTYSDILILTLLLYQTLKNLSYRETLEEAFTTFGKAPALSTYHYRVSKLPEKLLKTLLQELAKKLFNKQGNQALFLITDGTGFSYHDLYPLKLLRGLEVKNVKAHIRIVPIIAVTSSGRRIVTSAEAGGSYASEVKLFMEALKGVEPSLFKGIPLIADKCYDSIKIMKRLRELKIRPAIRVKETHRKGIKHYLRKRSKVLWNKWGGNRYLIESFFGTIKSKMGSHFKVKRENIAQKMGLALLVLYNMSLFASLFCVLFLLVVLERFSQKLMLVKNLFLAFLIIEVIFRTASAAASTKMGI